MKIELLIRMVYQIEGFFRSEPDQDEAIKNIADHMNRFWDPRMRSKLFDYATENPELFNTRAKAAISRLKPTSERFQMPIATDKKETASA